MSTSDRPSLEAARKFTRDLGPAAMAAGTLITFQGLMLTWLGSTFEAYFIVPLGLVLMLFGAAAFVRTDTLNGQLIRWAVVGTFAFGGGLALYQWAQLIWGGNAVVEGDLTMMGFYLMAGPALLVPAGLAVARPGWVPLIVVPAIVALASASILGHGALLIISLTDKPAVEPSLAEYMFFGGVVLSALALFFYSGQRGLTIARQQG